MSILEKFTVIDLIKTRSASVATVTGNILKFNNQTAAELHFASYIQVLINTKDKQFAIRACAEDAPNALPFSKPEGEQKYQIKISNAAITDLIRKTANWAAEDNWNIAITHCFTLLRFLFSFFVFRTTSPRPGRNSFF